jgi:hypothetical protein
MGEKAKPTPGRGERNIYCPYYGDCLDSAVDLSWQSWNCSECQHKMTRQAITQRDCLMSNPVTYYELPFKVLESIERDSVG